MVKKIFKKIIKFFSKLFFVYDLDIWEFVDDFNKEKINLRKNKKISNFEIKNFLIQTKIFLNPGWYFIGIKQKSNNKSLYMSLASKRKIFFQKRNIKSNKNRWRIIRLSNSSILEIQLFNIKESIEIENIWLIKIPFLFAFIRIISYVKSYKSLFNYKNIKFDKFSKFWKDYNEMHRNNIFGEKYISYQKWINTYESNFINKIISQKFENLDTFLITPLSEVRIFPKQKWLLFHDIDFQFKEYSTKILSFFLKNNPNLNLLYTDEDYIDSKNKRLNPNFKSSWNKELFLTKKFFSGTWIINSCLWNQAFINTRNSSFKNEFHTVLLESIRILENDKDKSNKVFHLPIILAHKKHWEEINKSKEDVSLKLKIIQEYIRKDFKFSRCGFITHRNEFSYRYSWNIKPQIKLSLLIPMRDKVSLIKACLASIKKYPPGIKIEVIIIDNDSKEFETLDFLNQFTKKGFADYKRKVIKISGKFNYSKLNNIAANKVTGEVILFLNNDIEFVRNNWGYELASNALRSDVGCVGAKLLYRDNTIQHAGIIMGMGGVAGHLNKHFYNNEDICHEINDQREYSALTGACLAISRDKWITLGGFDERNLKVNYSDVDLCLRCNEIGLKNIYLPQVLAYHLESKSRGMPKGLGYLEWKREAFYMKKRWKLIIASDKYFNPNLSLNSEKITLSFIDKKMINLR